MKKWEDTGIVTVQLNSFEVTLLLEILGKEQLVRQNNRIPSDAIEYLTTKIYRAMGVNI